MQKVVEFLEKHVQWVALGLGALWLLWMGYKYVLTPPASVEVAGQTLTAGKVDKVTIEKAVTPLQSAMNRTDAPEMPVENFAAAFQRTMNFEGAPQYAMSPTIWPPYEVPQAAPTPGVTGGPDRPVVAGVKAGAADLPAPPPAGVPADVLVGRSTIVPPTPVAGVQPAGQAPAGQAAPVGGQPVLNTNIDKDWVTQSFKIPVQEIGKQFAAANIPTAPVNLRLTAFLQVEMIREEQMSEGAWGKETILKPLENGMQRVAYPAAGAGRNLEHTYLNWAVANQGDVLQPAFYQVAQGDQWHKPGAPLLQMAVFNPAAHVGGKGTLTDEQWKQVLEYRREQYKLQQQQQRGQPRQPRPSRPGRDAPEDAMEGMYSPRDPDREAFAQVRRPLRPQQPYMGEFEDPALMEDPAMYEGDMGMAMQQVPVAGVPGVDFPTGEFEPAKWPKPEMECWVHDDTVEPGKTYRYKMRYRIKNPLYGTVNAAKNPKDALVFALTSADTAWGSPVSVPELTNFFIAGGRLREAPRMRFDIFRFHNGVQERQSAEFGPGDKIGRPERDIDFTTRWTIVDFRRDARDQDNVILVDDDGNTVIRNVSNDRGNPLYKKLQEEIANRDATAALQPNGR